MHDADLTVEEYAALSDVERMRLRVSRLALVASSVGHRVVLPGQEIAAAGFISRSRDGEDRARVG